MCYTKFRRFDWPAFLRALETGQTNRLYRTYVVTHSTSIPETTLHLRRRPFMPLPTCSVPLPVSGTLAQCTWHPTGGKSIGHRCFE